MPRTQSTPVKRWCFTINNYTEAQYAEVCALYPQTAKYIVVGKERGATGTPHIQGYIELVKKQRFSTVRALFKQSNPHLEAARGSAEANKEYCTKDGDYKEFGGYTAQGQRNDLAAVAEALDSGQTVYEVETAHPTSYIRYSRGIRDYHCILSEGKKRSTEAILCIIHGITGCGKSRFATEFSRRYFPLSTYYKPRGQWWDGYEGEKMVVIDDYYGWLKYDELLKISDRYPYRVPVKGGFRQFTSQLLVVTSNALPQD